MLKKALKELDKGRNICENMNYVPCFIRDGKKSCSVII